MSTESSDDGYVLLDENQAARLVILREVAKATTTSRSVAGTGLAYSAGDLMVLCEWVANGIVSLKDALESLPESNPES